jgi:hypothetical protein
MFLCNFAICVCFFLSNQIKAPTQQKWSPPYKDNVSGQQSNRDEVSLSSNVPFWKHMDFCNYKQPCFATWCYMVMLRCGRLSVWTNQPAQGVQMQSSGPSPIFCAGQRMGACAATRSTTVHAGCGVMHAL